MSQHFPKPHGWFRGNVKVELHIFNYVTKSVIKKETGVDASTFAKKVDLIYLKPDVEKSDIDQLKTVSNCFSNLKTDGR